MKTNEGICRHLLSLGLAIRKKIIGSRDVPSDSHDHGSLGGDHIFGIDRKVDDIVVSSMTALAERVGAITLVCEGISNDGVKQFPDNSGAGRGISVIIDPIDGSRTLMYDKRSAWFLAAAVLPCDAPAMLSRSIASVMVELPTSKQGLADHFCAFEGARIEGARVDLSTGSAMPLQVGASSATSLRNGFAQVANFFPGTKTLAAELMEHIATSTLGADAVLDASIFEDQYISTGGQFVELLMGRDRFCCDLRPLFHEIKRISGMPSPEGLCCHPYDIAGLMIAKSAGVILTDGFGHELDAPLSVSHGVHWCGYSNEGLRESVQPVIQEWLRSKGLPAHQ